MSNPHRPAGPQRRPHHSHSQPRTAQGKKFGHRLDIIKKLAETEPGSAEHAEAMQIAVETLLAPRRAINVGVDVFAHYPQLLHGAYKLGATAYILRIRVARLYWHRPLRRQLKRWAQYEANQRQAA